VANDYSSRPALSGDGRFVAFASRASNLVPGDTNRSRADGYKGTDVFVYDRRRARIRRVNVSTSGTQANDGSGSPKLSADGRFVAFDSSASNLVPGDTNGTTDVFVRDLRRGTIERVSVRSDGGQASGGGGSVDISADGRFVAFASAAQDLVADNTTGITGVFLHDRAAHTTVRVAAGPGGPSGVFLDRLRLSADGRVVAFSAVETSAPEGRAIHPPALYTYDIVRHTTELVSVSSSGQRPNSACLAGSIVRSCEPRNILADVSSDGRFVTFSSTASNLVPGDTNAATDVFVRDRLGRRTTRVSVASDGSQACPRGWEPYPDAPSYGPCGSGAAAASDDGRFITFFSQDHNLDRVHDYRSQGAGDVFLHDRRTGRTERVSVGTHRSGASSTAISGDGRFVAFGSKAPLLGNRARSWQLYLRGPLAR
jgi:Tol biopolymer transport system component